MKIVISLSKEEIRHLIACDSSMDACETVDNIIRKIKKVTERKKS